MLVLPPIIAAASLAQIVGAVALVALSALALVLVRLYHPTMRVSRLLAPVPGPRGRFGIGFAPQLAANLHRIHDFQVELMVKYGGRVNIPWTIFGNNILYLADPADVEYVLSTNVNNWIKSNHFLACVGEVFGKSFLGINHAHTKDGGAMWRLQRKVATRVFTTSNFKSFTEGIFHKYAMTLVDIIKKQNGKCDMHEIASQYTLQTTFDIVCGVPLQSLDEGLGLKFIKSMDFVFASVSIRLLLKAYFKYFWWCMPSEYRLKRDSKVMLDLVNGILEERLSENEEEIAKRFDLLSLFIKKARELSAEGESILDIATLRSIAASFLFAGRDTTSSTIVYAFYTLAQYPDEQDKILEELKSIDKETELTYEDVKRLKYLDAFVWETLRLYPSIPSNVKQAAEDDALPDGTFVPAGTEVMYTAYYMGRHNPIFGERREVFRPERWFEMKRRPTAYEFPVFQAGLRICLGMSMALLETKLFVATLLREFHVKIQDGEQLHDRAYSFGPTLAMAGGLPLQLTPRAVAA